jgi:hypothetical protein
MGKKKAQAKKAKPPGPANGTSGIDGYVKPVSLLTLPIKPSLNQFQKPSGNESNSNFRACCRDFVGGVGAKATSKVFTTTAITS